jgi:hypothetical protein
MKIDHLSDNELIKHVLKHDSDPIRIRLAGVMERFSGCIVDSLEDAGMDKEDFLFENTYDPGQYIRHLENEIEFLNCELKDAQEELRERETLTVAELIEELRHAASSASHRASAATERAREADQEREQMRDKMKVWRALSTDMSQ